MAKFICVMSGKGGAGKTTSAINLGLAITKLGFDVVVMDGNLSSPNLSLHLGSAYYPITIHDVMQDIHPIESAIYKHPCGLKIIPADISINSMKLVNFEKLHHHSQNLHMLTDYVIIDGSPGLGRESTQLINLTDEVLVVTNQDMPSVMDAKRLIEFVIHHNKSISGLVLTKHVNKKYKLNAQEIEGFLGLPIISKIPLDKKFDKTLHNKVPFMHEYPNRKASKAYFDLARKLTGKINV